jgi:hypothetical protein
MAVEITLLAVALAEEIEDMPHFRRQPSHKMADKQTRNSGAKYITLDEIRLLR